MATIRGIITESEGETIPMAFIFDSDATGNLIQGGASTSSDISGVYSIAPKGQFVTFRMSGFKNLTIPVSQLSAKPDVVMESSTTLKPVEVVAERIVDEPKEPEKKKFKIKPIHVIMGLAGIGLLIGGIVYIKSLKK